MPRRTVCLLDHPESPWMEFLTEFFEDTSSEVEHLEDSRHFQKVHPSKHPDIFFLNSDLMTKSFTQRLKVLKQSYPETKYFQIQKSGSGETGLSFDGIFDLPETLSDFQSQIVKQLPFPDILRVLIVDDEAEIGKMLREYLEGRSGPSFQVRYEENGQKGLEAIRKEKPDVLVLDVKMPVMTGHDVYREIKKQGWEIPVIIYFDAVSGHEIMEMHEIGNPAIVEKGSQQSSMPVMMALIKKMAYFG